MHNLVPAVQNTSQFLRQCRRLPIDFTYTEVWLLSSSSMLKIYASQLLLQSCVDLSKTANHLQW